LTEEHAFTEKKCADGFADLQLGSRYKIGTSELFEFKGTSGGVAFVGAGNTKQSRLRSDRRQGSAADLLARA
jgi:hypothetical protein